MTTNGTRALCPTGKPSRTQRQAQDLARWMRRNGWPHARAVECVRCPGWHAIATSIQPVDLAVQRDLARKRHPAAKAEIIEIRPIAG